MQNKQLLIVGITFVLLAVVFSGCISSYSSSPNTVLLHITVINDYPSSDHYEKIADNPTEVGVYEFYYTRPDLPGSGTFKKLDTITLQRKGYLRYVGEKKIDKIDRTLCVGYPPVNFIDGDACVEINQHLNEVSLEVHYWNCKIGIA